MTPPKSSKSSFLVVGAGISGLSAALFLARSGHSVRIIEKSSRSGGLAGAEFFRGIPCDIGSHRLHPAALEDPLFREIHELEPFLTRPRRGVLLFRRRRLPYPPAAFSMLLALGPAASFSLATGLLGTPRRGRAFAEWEKQRIPSSMEEDLGFARFVQDRVGEPAYRSFYEPYARKVWGLDPAELSQIVAKKRLGSSRPWALLQNEIGRLLARREGLSEPEQRLNHFVYPRRGISSIITYLERELAKHDVSISHNEVFDISRTRDEKVLFAGHLNDLGPTSLEHRGLYLVFLALPVSRAGENETYYSPDPEHYFGRVSELQHYSPELSRPGETILCVEIPEGTWGRAADFSRGPLYRTLLEQLRQAGILRAGIEPIELRQYFVPGVYPLYRRGFRASWRQAMQRILNLGPIFPFGRQALFLHCNLDHCVEIARAVVEHVLAGRGGSAWIEQAEKFLELRVRD
jgi:hypothetical protein